MTTSSHCTLCKQADSTLVQVGVRHASDLEVRRCSGCGLVYLWPRPTESELGEWYIEKYRKDYEEPPVAERYRGDLEEARVRVRRLIPFLKDSPSLLEIGSGSGAFLDSVRPHVGDVLGIEPDAASRDWIKRHLQLPVATAVDDVLCERKTFDVIVLFHVLEHVLEPVDFLISLKQILARNGILIVEVPNVTDALVEVYRIPAYLQFYYQKAHLYYFSKSTLSLTLQKANFASSIEGIQRYDLSNHIRWMLTGQPGGQSYYKWLLPSSIAAYNDSLIQSGYSDTLWAITRTDKSG